jgi:hypothetical protein
MSIKDLSPEDFQTIRRQAIDAYEEGKRQTRVARTTAFQRNRNQLTRWEAIKGILSYWQIPADEWPEMYRRLCQELLVDERAKEAAARAASLENQKVKQLDLAF